MKRRATFLGAAGLAAVLCAACTARYTPGLGELMSLQQMRHAKLWFAGQEKNWPLADLRLAVDSHDAAAFASAFGALTAGCNACHQATNFGFNVVKRPPEPTWFGNQSFAAE